MGDNYHEVLGVPADASPAVIKAAFRRLVRRFHPDVSIEKNASQKFDEVVKAYRAWEANSFQNIEQKSEPEKHEQGESTTSDSAASKPSSEYHAEPAAVDGEDCQITAHLSVEELYWGVELKLNPSSLCPGRRGKKPTTTSILKVKVPRGTSIGTKLCLRGKGEAGSNGGQAGNVYVVIKLKSHERYEVVGSNLFVDMPLSSWEAKEGAIVDVVTPAGRIEVDVPAGIASGQSVCVPERGLLSAKGDQGDLFAVARVIAANKRTEKLKQWPHLMHNDIKRWRPAGINKGGNIDVRC